MAGAELLERVDEAVPHKLLGDVECDVGGQASQQGQTRYQHAVTVAPNNTLTTINHHRF